MKQIILSIAAMALAFNMSAQKSVQPVSIVPQPVSIVQTQGSFVFKPGLQISYADDVLKPCAEYLAGKISPSAGFQLGVVKGVDGGVALSLDPSFGHESGYRLEITSSGVKVTANDYRGAVCAAATLRQLLPDAVETATVVKKLSMPCLTIEDYPAYEWRGLMLDVSRHFFNKEEVMAFLDKMALYKFNKFHWHLTDDQGWRIEIKKYPLLTEKGGWREFNYQDRVCMEDVVSLHNEDFRIPENKLKITAAGDTLYGGFYTQGDIREVVAFAAERGIDVIPEIDMPGHSLCAEQNYEGISCEDSIGWGQVFSSPICPGKESALRFATDVYSEVFQLFPYLYVHIGGDEVEKDNWKECPDCQARIKALGLKDEKELQSWFIKYMEMFFNAHNRRLIGWDEIIEGGLSRSATITWWRGWSPESVEIATSQGNDVIFCQNNYSYFDYDQNNSTMQTLYEAEYYTRPLTEEQRTHIKGYQGNLWTEWIPSVERCEYQVFPRALALAEKCWTPEGAQSWDSFSARMKPQIDRLFAMGVDYRPQELENYMAKHVFTDKATVVFECKDAHTQVRYTVDGTMPTMASKLYTKPFTITKTTDYKVRLFREDGKPGAVYSIRYEKQSYVPAADAPAGLSAGLAADWHDYAGELCSEIRAAKLNRSFIVDGVEIPKEARGNIGLYIKGFIDIPADDIYTFCLLSDDGSTLLIDGEMTVDNDKAHSPREVKGQKAVRTGLHTLEAYYFDHNGGTLRLRVFNSKGEEVKVKFLH